MRLPDVHFAAVARNPVHSPNNMKRFANQKGTVRQLYGHRFVLNDISAGSQSQFTFLDHFHNRSLFFQHFSLT